MVEAYANYLLRHIDYYLPPAETKAEPSASAETKAEADPSASAEPSAPAESEAKEPGREVLYPHVAILINRQMRHLRQFLKSPPHGINPGGPMRDRRAGLFAYLDSSRKKHQQCLRVHEKGRQRARRGAKKGSASAAAESSGSE